MPLNTEPQLALPPDKNLTFTQFFTKLLIKVPQVDIEKLPSYLLRDHLVPDEDFIEEHEEDDTDDIYSLEHKLSVEEFKPTDIPAKFIKPIKLKFQRNRVDEVDLPATQIQLERENVTNIDDDTDSFTCTVEESNFISFEEESLDLTVSDEFMEECVREQTVIVPEEETFHNPSHEHHVPDKSKSEEEYLFENERKEINVDETTYVGLEWEEHLTNFEQYEAVGEKDTCIKEKMKDPIGSESDNDKVELSNGMQNLQRSSDAQTYFANDENTKSDSNKSVECETPVEQKGGEHDGIAAVKFKSIGNLQYVDPHIVNSTFEQEHASVIESSDEQIIGTDEDYTKDAKRVGNNDSLSEIYTSKISHEYKKEAFQNKEEMSKTENNDKDLKEYVKIHPVRFLTETETETNKRQEKEVNSQLKVILIETETSSVMDFNGCCADNEIQDNEPLQGKDEKGERNLNEHNDTDVQELGTNKRQEQIGSNHKESFLCETEAASAMDIYGCCSNTDIENRKPVKESNEKEFAKAKAASGPPALKIRIFTGNTGELINKEEARRGPKRKKKIKDRPMKMLKLAPIPSQKTVENDTQSRIIQELPGCNWLEQKIRKCENTKKVTSQTQESSSNPVDELLETDSDDDHLVVDDQSENSEVTTSFPSTENDVEDIIIEKEFGPMMKVLPEIKWFKRAEGSDPTLHYMKVNHGGKLMNDESMVYPSNNKTVETHPFKYMLGNLMKKMDDNTSTGQHYNEISLQNTIKPFVNEFTKIKNNKGNAFKQAYNKSKTEESKQFQNRPTEKSVNIFEQYQTKLKPIKPNKAREELEEQDTYKTTTAKAKSSKESYERRMEEANTVYINAQNLHYKQQMLENQRLKEQLVRDIKDLKNKKMKEMEDLIEIKTKKEQTMTDLENLKSEIFKNKAFLISLKKINIVEQTHKVNHKSSENKPIDKSHVNAALASVPKNREQIPILKRSASLNFREKHLPDLVNHEKLGVMETNEQLQKLTLSTDYQTYLQRTIDSDSNSSKSPLYQAKTFHNNPDASMQHRRIPIQQYTTNRPKYQETVQAIAPNNSRPHISSEQIGHQQYVNSPTVPRPNDVLTDDQNSILATDFNSQQFCPSSTPVSISRVGSSGGMMRIQSEDRRKSWENIRSQNTESVGYLRPGEFSREAAATSPTEVAQFRNISNYQYPITPNQQSQNRQANIDIPEIQSTLASRTVSHDIRANSSNTRPATQRQQNYEPQADNPIILSNCCVCSKVANFICSGCQKVYYCTVQCQRNHWLGHYAECRGTRH